MVWLSTTNFTTLASATAKFLNKPQTFSRGALVSAACLIRPARFSAASFNGRNSFMQGGSPRGGPIPGGPAIPGAPCIPGEFAKPGGGPLGAGGAIAPPVPGVGSGGAWSHVGRFPDIGTCAAADPANTQKTRPVSAATRHNGMAGSPSISFPAASGRLPLAFKQPSDFGDKAAN